MCSGYSGQLKYFGYPEAYGNHDEALRKTKKEQSPNNQYACSASFYIPAGIIACPKNKIEATNTKT